MERIEKYYEQIKDLIIDTETTVKIKDYSKNKVMLENYYEIGKLIIEAQGGEEKAKYGNQLIKKFSNRLALEIGKKYDDRLLRKMRQFYLKFMDEKWASLKAKLEWSHYKELLPLKDINEIKYYMDITVKQNLTYRELHKRIKNNEYKNLSEETKLKLIENKKPELIELINEPIIISNPSNREIIKEKELQKLIMENITIFLRQLGEGYLFDGNEYKIKIGTTYHRIDLLLYNKKYSSYVVIELKIGKLKKEHIGQIETYMNYVDKEIKDIYDNKTIGIILCHRNNKLLMEYCSNPNIVTREYIFN